MAGADNIYEIALIQMFAEVMILKKILVLMATYNGEKFIKQQLDSVYGQKDVYVSVLVRDDGSTDGTIEILKEYSNSHELEWYANGHLGVKYGFYELMQKAALREWDYVAFCDQDDVWDEDKLITAVNRLNNTDLCQPSLYYCGQRLVDINLNMISNHLLNRDRSIYARFLLNDAAGCTEVFNRKLLEVVISYRPEYMLMHDAWIVKVCLALGGSVVVDSDAHMSYRQHGNNVVGLKRDILSKIRQAKYYIYEQDVVSQMKELKKGYYDRIIPEYKSIVDDTLIYKNSLAARKRLIDKTRINYSDRGLQITYWLKVMMNKL